jgi:hypothetical protein
VEKDYKKSQELLAFCASILGKVMRYNGMDIIEAANKIRAAVDSEQVKPPTTVQAPAQN